MPEELRYLNEHREYLSKKLKKCQKRLANVEKVISKKMNEDNPQVIPITE